jgi:hypothetical protein
MGMPTWWVYDANHTTDDLPHSPGQPAMDDHHHHHQEEDIASASRVARLSELTEPLAAVSLSHLQPATRDRLRRNALSINAYPTADGGLVFVGSPRHRIPAEHDLASITKLAEEAGIAWLLFDAEAPVVAGLPVFGTPEDL